MSEQEQIEFHFRRLERLLPEQPLRTEKGSDRVASPDEFMLMVLPEGEKGSASFKHRYTRHYVHIIHQMGRDYLVPTSGSYFDAYPEELAVVAASS